jgi:hypothetical protein
MLTSTSLLARFGLSDNGPYSFLGTKAYFFSYETEGKGVLFVKKGVTRAVANRINHGLVGNECVLTGRFLPDRDLTLNQINDTLWDSEELFYLLTKDHIYQLGGVLLELSEVDAVMSVLPTLSDLKVLLSLALT